MNATLFHRGLQHSDVAGPISFGLLYFLLAWLGCHVTLAPELGVAAWPPGGLLMATLLRKRREGRAGLLLAAAVADVLAGLTVYDFPIEVAFTITVGNLLESVIGAALLLRWSGGAFALADIPSAVAFIAFGGCLAPIASMLIGGTIVGLHTHTPLPESWRLWWTGDSLGILIVGPLVLSLHSGSWGRFKAAGYIRHGDLIGLVAALLMLGHLCLGYALPIAFALVPLLIWAALRHGIAGSSMAATLIFTQAVLYSAHGRGPFVSLLALPLAQLVVQAFCMVLASTGLVLAASATATRNSMEKTEGLVRERTAALHERETQLEQSLSELKAMDERKDNFLAMLAHELLNPLAPLRNGIALLERPISAEKSRKIQQMMSRQVNVLAMLVTDLMDLARLKRGQLQIASSIVSVDEIVHSAMAAMEHRFAAKLQSLHYQPAEPGLRVKGDGPRLIQVLMNLLGNASRHCPDGTPVHVRCGQSSGTAWISVEDEGPGIPPERLQSIFNLYEQAARDSNEGLGIGLALVKQFVELHHGTIEVASEVRHGTRFTIRLPLISG
jgi:signal transduction histidine kinase